MLPLHARPKGIHDNEVLYLYSTTLLCRSDEREDDDNQAKNKNKTLPPKPLQRSSSVSLCGLCIVILGAQWLKDTLELRTPLQTGHLFQPQVYTTLACISTSEISLTRTLLVSRFRVLILCEWNDCYFIRPLHAMLPQPSVHS